MKNYKETGVAPVRALVSDYSNDKNTYSIDDQYLLGDCLMVAPLTENDGGKRRVYIPDGEWADYRTGESIESGWHDVVAERIPVYRKV